MFSLITGLKSNEQMSIPDKSVTFLFTDIEGSTKLSQEFPDKLPAALDRHHAILQNAIESNKGFVFEIIGDAFCAAFDNSIDAVNAAVDAQINLKSENWDEAVIKVRIGIHAGNAEWNGKRYMGYITLARTARVMSAANGEQILISGEAYDKFKETGNPDITDKKDIDFRDLGERRLKDIIQPIRLYQITANGIRKDFPPLKTLDARPNNLPVQLTSFIGRENEIQQIKKFLRNSRLVTLSGTGGAGKTRLALQAGADLIDEFANGIYLVELAAIPEAALILQTIADSLNLKEEKETDLLDTIINYLKEKEILLILDNTEHLIKDCAEISEKLLESCNKLKIIATSREALNCSGEQLFRIPSLSVPDMSEKITAEELLKVESVRLFVERALSVNPDFRLNESNSEFIAGICSKLDGIPLGIELAAARIKLMSAEKIHERLNDRFRLLTGGKRTALLKHQTLKAMIDWSYDLLSEKEKILWNRLSVFKGCITSIAAGNVCSDVNIDSYEIFELMSMLSEKSILVYDETTDIFRMLETIREYGKEKLTEEESGIIEYKHFNYFLEFAEHEKEFTTSSEMQNVLSKFDLEKGNLESALLLAADKKYHEQGLKLSAAMGSYWNIRGHYSEAKRWLEHFIYGYDKEDQLLGNALNHLGRILQLQGNKNESLNSLQKSVSIMRQLGNENGLSSSLNNLSLFYFEQGEYSKAEVYLNESLDIQKKTGDRKGSAYSMNYLGIINLEKGQYEKAVKMFNDSAVIQREFGDIRGLAYSLSNLGNIAYDTGDYKKSLDFYEECISIFRELDDKRGTAFSMCALGNIYYFLGDFDKAESLLKESIGIFRKINEKRGIAFSLCSLATLTLHNEDFEQTYKLIEESLEINRETDNSAMIGFGLFNLANAKLVEGKTEEALKLFEESLEISRRIEHKPGIAYNLNCIGYIAYLNNQIEKSELLLTESMKLNLELNQNKEICSNILGFAETEFAKGNYGNSATLMGAFSEFFNINNLIIEIMDSKRSKELLLKLKSELSQEDLSKFTEAGRKLNTRGILNSMFNEK